MTVTANGPGAYGNLESVTVLAPTDGVYNHADVQISYLGKTYWYKNIDISTGQDNTLTVVGTDDGNPAILTKTASGVLSPMLSTPLAGGTDGSIADADYTASNKGVNIAASAPGVGIVFVAERMTAAVKAVMYTLSATSSDRMWIIGPDNESVAAATAITEAASYRTDRFIYAFNAPYTIDPSTAAEVVTHPTSWMASILSQTDIDIHPGDKDNAQFLQGITRLFNESYVRNDYIAFRAAGICALEHLDGYGFVSGVTTSLVVGKEQITRRRMADFLQISVAQALGPFVKKKNTLTRRKAMNGMIVSFLQDLQGAERVVQAFKVDGESLNTDNARAQDIEHILMRVRLISHMLEIVLETEIGTSVTIVQAQ